MALKASCPFCKRNFSAPEEYRGKRVDCPSCARKVLVQTQDEVQAEEAQQEALQRKREEDRDKIALIERMDSRARHRAGRPSFEEFQTGSHGIRNFNQRVSSKFQRFRALSDFLVLGAYLELLLVGVGLGLLIYLKISGVIHDVALFFSVVLIWLIAGAGLYLFFKFLGELACLLADVGDQHNDMVQLLLDIRENTQHEESTPEDVKE